MKHTKKLGILLIVLMLLGLFVLPVSAALAQSTGTLVIRSIPAGADVYLDDSFARVVTPCTLTLAKGTYKIKLIIPGYETYTNTNVQIIAGSITTLDNIQQLPRLTPVDAAHTITVNTLEDKARWNDVAGMDAITVAELKADAGIPVSLREAIAAVKNEPAESGHYRIEFASELTGGTIHMFKAGNDFPVSEGYLQNLYIEKRGNLTVNGDINCDGIPDITIDAGTNGILNSPKSFILNTYASNVTIAGIKFDGTSNQSTPFATLVMRVPENNTKRYDVNSVSVLGCKFENSFEVGIATCGQYGNGGNAAKDKTANYSNIVFAGNTFINTALFSFAGAGDEDYNTISGYYVAANNFTNNGIGVIAGDAHTWYVYGANSQAGNGGVEGQNGYCENNRIENLHVNGNSININDSSFNARMIGVNTANLGNSGNIIENVYIRNNKTRVTAPNSVANVQICNASMGADGRYTYYTNPGTRHNTANNILRNVNITDNDLQMGDSREFNITNIEMGWTEKSGMNSTGNLIENIKVADNKISAICGVKIAGILGYNRLENNDISGNIMRNILFNHNEVSRINTGGYEHRGLVITGFFNDRNDFIPSYHANSVTNIAISANSIFNYKTGIIIAGSTGNAVNAHSVNNITVNGNTVVCQPDGDYGIITAGAAINGYGGDVFCGSTNCEAKNVTVTKNTVIAPGGILLAGSYIDAPVKSSLAGNKVTGTTIKNNTLKRIEGSNNNRTLPGITVAGIVEQWSGRIANNTLVSNNSPGTPYIGTNVSFGFKCNTLNLATVTSSYPVGSTKTATKILADLAGNTNSVLGGNAVQWSWQGTAFSSAFSGSFVAKASRKAILGFDTLYYNIITYKPGSNGTFQPATGVTLNKTATTIRIGSTVALTAIVSPANATNKAVTWNSSNKAVAIVDTKGKVTGISVGTAVITIKTKNGGKMATCKVTVVIPVTGVTLNKTSASLKAGAGTATITVKTVDGGKKATCAVIVG
jgi:uncharacterized protein YjdB